VQIHSHGFALHYRDRARVVDHALSATQTCGMKLASDVRMNDYAIGRAKEYAAGIQSTELKLVDVPASPPKRADGEGTSAPPNGTIHIVPRQDGFVGSTNVRASTETIGLLAPRESLPATPAASGEPRSGATDKFMIAAAKELEAGIIDQPLWQRALAQSAGDRVRATEGYLRARATALRVQKRDKRQERMARRVRALGELGGPETVSSAPAAPTAQAYRRAGPKRKHVLWMGGALAFLFLIAVWFAIPALQHDAVKATAPAGASTMPKVARSTAPSTSTPKQASDAGDDLPSRVQTLKDDGNWNLVVLYAGEWTRKQPTNAEAWKELAQGYIKLRQYRDALDAASKVVQFGPADAEAWQTLGQINLALQQPAEALAAFEQAVARDEHDLASIVQTGVLNTQLGHLPEARLAFAKALALNPQDVEALCGASSLAQKEGRAKDAESITRDIASLGSRCREGNVGETVRVAVGAKPAAATAR
jgi:tetratricopeptide (TPR) repeat protein